MGRLYFPSYSPITSTGFLTSLKQVLVKEKTTISCGYPDFLHYMEINNDVTLDGHSRPWYRDVESPGEGLGYFSAGLFGKKHMSGVKMLTVSKIWYFCCMNQPSATFRFTELAELDTVASDLLVLGENLNVWLFHGHMGAGKTTLIKSLCKQLGVRSVVQSPTFALVNDYLSSSDITIFHFDFYRIKDETEALDIGVEEYFDSGNFCFVEWPEKIESLWPEQYLHLELYLGEDGARVLTATPVST